MVRYCLHVLIKIIRVVIRARKLLFTSRREMCEIYLCHFLYCLLGRTMPRARKARRVRWRCWFGSLHRLSLNPKRSINGKSVNQSKWTAMHSRRKAQQSQRLHGNDETAHRCREVALKFWMATWRLRIYGDPISDIMNASLRMRLQRLFHPHNWSLKERNHMRLII